MIVFEEGDEVVFVAAGCVLTPDRAHIRRMVGKVIRRYESAGGNNTLVVDNPNLKNDWNACRYRKVKERVRED